MYGFSKIVLEHTLELTAEAIPTDRDRRVAEHIGVIRRYLNWIADEWPASNYYEELRAAVSELSIIAVQHHELLIAARLQTIVRQLSEPSQKPQKTSQSESESRNRAILRLLLG